MKNSKFCPWLVLFRSSLILYPWCTSNCTISVYISLLHLSIPWGTSCLTLFNVPQSPINVNYMLSPTWSLIKEKIFPRILPEYFPCVSLASWIRVSPLSKPWVQNNGIAIIHLGQAYFVSFRQACHPQGAAAARERRRGVCHREPDRSVVMAELMTLTKLLHFPTKDAIYKRSYLMFTFWEEKLSYIHYLK